MLMGSSVGNDVVRPEQKRNSLRDSPFSVGSLELEKRLVLKVPDLWRIGTLSAEKDMVR